MTLQGRRVAFRAQWEVGQEPLVGDYWQEPNGKYSGVAPGGHYCNLANHTVREHEDGTISVSPSIRVTNGSGQELWHGFLKKGIWRLDEGPS